MNFFKWNSSIKFFKWNFINERSHMKWVNNPFIRFGGNINVKVDLSNYATKADIKNITHVDTSSFALKTDLAGLKTEVEN